MVKARNEEEQREGGKQQERTEITGEEVVELTYKTERTKRRPERLKEEVESREESCTRVLICK